MMLSELSTLSPGLYIGLVVGTLVVAIPSPECNERANERTLTLHRWPVGLSICWFFILWPNIQAHSLQSLPIFTLPIMLGRGTSTWTLQDVTIDTVI